VVSAADGRKMYDAYCEACHGTTGKGDGPAAAILKDPVPDLTTLSQSHNGKYPSGYIVSVLRFGVQGNPAHGNKDMPIWGPIFQSMSSTASETSGPSMRISNLNRYLETLQVK
jgi:mono/diheme cytochrome c family protein